MNKKINELDQIQDFGNQPSTSTFFLVAGQNGTEQKTYKASVEDVGKAYVEYGNSNSTINGSSNLMLRSSNSKIDATANSLILDGNSSTIFGGNPAFNKSNTIVFSDNVNTASNRDTHIFNLHPSSTSMVPNAQGCLGSILVGLSSTNNVSNGTLSGAVGSLSIGNENTCYGARTGIIVGLSNFMNGGSMSFVLGRGNGSSGCNDAAIVGDENKVSSIHGSQIIGSANTVNNSLTDIIVGSSNKFSGSGSTAKGSLNLLISFSSTMNNDPLKNTILGGESNLISTTSYVDREGTRIRIGNNAILGSNHSTVTNYADSFTIVGGDSNYGSGTTAERSSYAIIAGGGSHKILNGGFSGIFSGSSSTIDSSGFSIALGGWGNSITNGNYSIVGGFCSTVSGDKAFAFGDYINNPVDNAFVVGYYNDTLSSATGINAPIFVVGNGNSSTHSNALVVRADGRATVGKDPIDSMDVATKAYVDAAIASIVGPSNYVPISASIANSVEGKVVTP